MHEGMGGGRAQAVSASKKRKREARRTHLNLLLRLRERVALLAVRMSPNLRRVNGEDQYSQSPSIPAPSNELVRKLFPACTSGLAIERKTVTHILVHPQEGQPLKRPPDRRQHAEHARHDVPAGEARDEVDQARRAGGRNADEPAP